jgi:hypothetical protein
MSGVYIEFDNLTEQQQLELLSNIYLFARDKLPEEVMLVIKIDKKLGGKEQ